MNKNPKTRILPWLLIAGFMVLMLYVVNLLRHFPFIY